MDSSTPTSLQTLAMLVVARSVVSHERFLYDLYMRAGSTVAYPLFIRVSGPNSLFLFTLSFNALHRTLPMPFRLRKLFHDCMVYALASNLHTRLIAQTHVRYSLASFEVHKGMENLIHFILHHVGTSSGMIITSFRGRLIFSHNGEFLFTQCKVFAHRFH